MAEDFEYASRFIVEFDFGLITLVRRSDASWIQDVADILSDVASDVLHKGTALRFGWRSNGFAIHTSGDSNEDFFVICTQICGIVSRFFSLGLPIRGALTWGRLFEWAQNGTYVQFGPATQRANVMLCQNESSRIVVDPAIPIRGLERQIIRDDQVYLDVLDGAFLKDYWDLHHRSAHGVRATAFDFENALELASSMEQESSPEVRPIFAWLKAFVARDR